MIITIEGYADGQNDLLIQNGFNEGHSHEYIQGYTDGFNQLRADVKGNSR